MLGAEHHHCSLRTFASYQLQPHPCRAEPLLPFDWPCWSDAQGNAVRLSKVPEREGERGWFVVRTPGTDEDGWCYGTVFSKLSMPRAGGRACKRTADFVRSRLWRKLVAHREMKVGRGGRAAAPIRWPSALVGFLCPQHGLSAACYGVS